MKAEKIYPIGFAANSYILTEDGKNAVVVDPAQPRIEDELEKRGLRPAFVLLTHAHFDHVGGVSALQKRGARVLCSEREKTLVGSPADLSEEFGAPRSEFTVDGVLKDGETRELCALSVTAIATPGHTAGGACAISSAARTERGRCLRAIRCLREASAEPIFPRGTWRRSVKALKGWPPSKEIFPFTRDMRRIPRWRRNGAQTRLCATLNEKYGATRELTRR